MKKNVCIVFIFFLLVNVDVMYGLGEKKDLVIGGKTTTFSQTSPNTWTSANGYTILDKGSVNSDNVSNFTINFPNGTKTELEVPIDGLSLEDAENLAMTAIADSINKPTQNSQNPKSLNDSDVKDNILGVEEGKLRKGDVDMNTIPLVIVNIISVLLGVAGTVAVFSLIYHAVQMQINSGITGDSSGVDKAKKGMIGSLIGFVIAISAWFLVTRAVDLLSTIS